MPVGTYGTVKAMTPEELDGPRRADHPRQHLSPDAAAGHRRDPRARRAARLHALAGADPHRLRRLPGLQPRGAAQDHRGRACSFRSPVNGDAVFLSPEISMEVQAALGADIVMAFDECPPYPATEAAGARRRWSGRCAGRAAAATSSTRLANPNALFGIVQGGMYLRPAAGVARPAARTSASTATRSAGSPSASRRPSAMRVLEALEPRAARATGRAT